MANVAKYTMSSCNNLLNHFERKKDEKGIYINFGNIDIDIAKTHLNYNLAPSRSQMQLEYLNKRKGEVKCLNRKDVNLMASWVITAPSDVLEKKDEEIFFKLCYEFLKKRYGGENEKNIISSFVHMDETTPHMHFAFIPIVRDKKNNKEKISAKEVLSKKELQIFHNDLQAYFDNCRINGLITSNANILTNQTKKYNLSVSELKKNRQIYEDLTSKIKYQSEVLEIGQNKIKNIKKQYQNLKSLEQYKKFIMDIHKLNPQFDLKNKFIQWQKDQQHESNKNITIFNDYER